MQSVNKYKNCVWEREKENVWNGFEAIGAGERKKGNKNTTLLHKNTYIRCDSGILRMGCNYKFVFICMEMKEDTNMHAYIVFHMK